MECIVNMNPGAHRYIAKPFDTGYGIECIIIEAGIGVFPIKYEEDIDRSMEPLFKAFCQMYQAGFDANAAKAKSAAGGNASES